ncbi:MAG: Hsp70 family protein [Chthoniobacteraceae bacterium]|jgi:molecular chaperone DnaK
MIVGIDLGTTNSLIGVMEAGFPILLANRDGERLTPSVVHFPAGGEPLAGAAAARMRAVDPENTVYSIKRFMGRRAGEEPVDVPYRVAGRTGAALRVSIRGVEYSPEQISALILGRLKQQAEEALDTAVSRAVITVPAYFNDGQRAATKAAGELAGLTVERIVNEPTAAALAYGLDRLGEKSKVAVYDFGGGTFDISILELNGGVFQVLATNGNTRLGGDDIDEAIIAHSRLPIADYRLREIAIEAKHRLSIDEEARIELPFVEGAASEVFTLTREELERIARPIVERTREHCLRSLADARLAPGDLDAVILVGGQTRMPLIRRYVAEIFGREPDVSQNPDEAVAIGATVQAGILSGVVQNIVLLDVTPLSLGIETFGGMMNVIIPRNTTIPAKAGEMFTNAMAGQQSMLIRVLQGEREMARDNWELGGFDLGFDPAPKGQARVGVQFEIDANGILHVLARDVKTGTEKIVEIKSAIDVSDQAVEEMIASSVEHAFDDMSERVFTEARLKAEEMLPAARAALDQLGDAVDGRTRETIARLMGDVESALESREVQRLKKANAALDEGTQEMAALLVERAMDEALKRKGVV